MMASQPTSMSFDPRVHRTSGPAPARRDTWLSAGLLILLAAVVLLPGIGAIPVVDRDEARFAQASRQMLESGTLEGWTIPMVGDRPRLNKPPLIYWLQAGTAGAATGFDASGDAIWMYRLPSVLAAFATILIVWRIGVSMFGGRTGLLAGAFMAVSPILVFDAHMARSDELLLTLTTGAMGVLWTCWRDARRRVGSARLPIARTTLLWILVGLGMLAKGPITPLVVVLTTLALSAWARNWRWIPRLRPVTGLLILLAIFCPWVVLASYSVGFDTLWQIAYDEVIVRSSAGRESHGAPPGYHLVLLLVLMWPGTLLTGVALGRSLGRARRSGLARGNLGTRLLGLLLHPAHGRGAESFCLAWIVPCWILFELAATKLPHYPLPLYPALALVSARAVLAGARALPQVRTLGARLGFSLWFLLGLGIVAFPGALLFLAWGVGDLAVPPAGSPRTEGVGALVLLTLAIGALLGVVILILALIRALSGRLLEAQLLAIPAAAISLALVFGLVLPAAWPIWITPRLEHVLADGGVLASGAPVAAVGYHEDSLVYATRGRLERIGPQQVAAWVTEHPNGWLILPSELAQTSAHLSIVGHVEGFNYSNGDHFDLAVARVE